MWRRAWLAFSLSFSLTVAVVLIGLAPAQAGTVPTHQAPTHAPLKNVGVLWGANVDAQIRQAISQDNGAETPFAYSWLAWGIAQRSPQGWNDPAALHYLHAATSQANPYGLGYAYDAFQNGTTNPASTIYSVTLVQVGWALLDAYEHGQASYGDVTDIIAKILAQPRIAVQPGVGLSYSNSNNDARPGYSVHNVNQAVAIFLQDTLDAGITWNTGPVEDLIAGLNTFEFASYQPGINGWAYRDGGRQTIQDAAHSGLGAQWGQRFHPSTIGVPNTRHMMTTDYGFVWGSGVHASLAQFDCTDSRRWLPQYREYMATYTDFGSAAKAAPMMAQSAAACGAPAPRVSFALKSKAATRATHTVTRHNAPDNLRR